MLLLLFVSVVVVAQVKEMSEDRDCRGVQEQRETPCDVSLKGEQKTTNDEEWESFEEEFTLLAEVEGLDAALMQHDLSYTLVVCVSFKVHLFLCFFFACLNEEGINRAQRPRIRCCALEKSSMKATTLTLLAPICFLTPLQRTKAQEEQHGPAFKSVLLGRATSVWFSSELKLSHARPQRIQSHLLH